MWLALVGVAALAQDPSEGAASGAPTGGEPAAEAPTEEEATPVAPSAVDEPEPAAAPVAPDPDPDVVYLRALRAWNGRSWGEARRGAEEALALDADHAPARLLLGYALLREGRRAEGAAALTELAAERPRTRDEERARREARKRLAWVVGRETRDDLSLAFGPGAHFTRTWDQGGATPGWTAELRLPLPLSAGPLALGARLDTTWPAPGFRARSVYLPGPRVAALAVASLPLGGGVLRADLAVGPDLWLVTGDGPATVHPGARAAAGLDLRATPATGLRLEVATAVPQALPRLQLAYARTVELRFLATVHLPTAPRP